MGTNPFWPLFLTIFFGIFHLLGGAAIGQAVRAAQRGSDQAMSLVLWGAGMGLVPLVFDWFFLIAPGHWIYGFVGPILLIVAACASLLLHLHMDGPAVISAALGSAAFLLGLLSIPLLLDAAKQANPGLTDYVCGGVFVLLFVAIGGAFAWNGFSAIVRGISLDQAYAAREQKQDKRRKRPQD